MNTASPAVRAGGVSRDLLRRYDRQAPRYTSYPTAVEFTSEFTEDLYWASLREADRSPDDPLSLYVHIPFCRERCAYCGCNVVVARRASIVDEYLDRLDREIGLVADHLPNRRRVTQLHWGGGTPTHLSPAQLERLARGIFDRFEVDPEGEIAVEIDPRVTTPEQLRLLRRLGFNRTSIGVQDLTPEVQTAIARNQTVEETVACYEACRELGFRSINLDLIYGLPEQTPARMTHTLDEVARLRPDRIAIYSYAHLPKLKPHQRRIPTETLPTPETKLELFAIARQTLLAAGYDAIGMDHFALPDDELVLARSERRLHRNFMGYTVKKGSDVIGLGLTSIGQVGRSMAQNAKKLSTYYASVDAGRLPVERGLVLTRDDEIRRAVILELMCNFVVEPREVGARYGIDFDRYFEEELRDLRAPDGPVRHGLVEIHPDRIEVVGPGRLFVRNVCVIFDRYRREASGADAAFSRTV